MYEFKFVGGVVAPGRLSLLPRYPEAIQTREQPGVKFLLFLILNGQEIPLYQALREGIAAPVYQAQVGGDNRFQTGHPHVKVFVGEELPHPSRFRRYYSFFVKLSETESKSQILTILPFPDGQRAVPEFCFKAKGKFLTKNQALEVLAPDSDSRAYLKRQSILPVEVLRKMIRLDRKEVRSGVRAIRIQQKPKKEEE